GDLTGRFHCSLLGCGFGAPTAAYAVSRPKGKSHARRVGRAAVFRSARFFDEIELGELRATAAHAHDADTQYWVSGGFRTHCAPSGERSRGTGRERQPAMTGAISLRRGSSSRANSLMPRSASAWVRKPERPTITRCPKAPTVS